MEVMIPITRVVAKPFTGPDPKNKQDDTGDQGGKVTVDNSRKCIFVTVGYSHSDTLAGHKFLTDTFIDQHVGINRHTDGKHDTGNTGQV